MALTALQRRICRLIAAQRIAVGERYVTGGVALTTVLGTDRVSRDIDLFHDTEEAVAVSWAADRTTLAQDGLSVEPRRERPGLVEALVSDGSASVLVEWARDSAFRFFPLVSHPDLGLTLHPFDLATNKVLALVGRLEVRDWLDVLACDERIQPLGYLAWAAAGKDPGFNPAGILAVAARTGRYTQVEIDSLQFAGDPPSAAALAAAWHAALERARAVVDLLPGDQVGTCVLDSAGSLCRDAPAILAQRCRQLRFHPGSIGGALPRVGG
jgi:hypothetical protein